MTKILFPKNLIIHILPDNLTVCGGVKVHIQLSELEQELGYDSFVAFPKRGVPTWFKHSATCISYDDAAEFLNAVKGTSVKRIVIGWEDIDILDRFDADVKIAYIQGESLIKHTYKAFEDFVTHSNGKIWYSSKWNRQANKAPDGSLVSPYINTDIFTPAQNKELSSDLRIMVLTRKHGREEWSKVANHLSAPTLSRLKVIFHDNTSEDIFASILRNSDIFFTHSSPEGLGLPPLEAMASKVLVIGYPGGGGTDFMKAGINCLSSPTSNALHVAGMLHDIVYGKVETSSIVEEGYKTVLSRYSKDNTLDQLKVALDAVIRF
ncbi:MAG: glycosyltransferase [Methanogenium sp.]|jgi:glycosyltransferase involved in cell wall biosynthesis